MTTSAPGVDLVDPHCPHPNIGGIPLFLLPNPLSREDALVVTELHGRLRAARSLACYASRVVLDEPQQPALHHRIMCDAIDDLLSPRSSPASSFDDLLITCPPGSAKSTYSSHAAASYFLGQFPHKNIILATHTADLSERWSRKVRNTLMDPRHANVFPASTLSKDSTAVGRWETSRGGQFLAVGVGASILGFRADMIVIDDAVSGFEEAQSITRLQKIHEWFETDLLTRLKPGGKIVQICQRLSPNDLAGYMIKRHELNPTRRLRVLTFRMVTEPNDEPDGTNRQPGDILWPEWFTPQMVEDARRDDFRWRTLYQQKPPSDDGSWVSPQDIRHRPGPLADPSVDRSTLDCYGMTDLALTVNGGDYTVHFIVAVAHDGGWDIIFGQRSRVDPERTANDILDLCQTFRPREWLIDDDNASRVLVPLLATAARARSVHIPYKAMPMRGQNKEVRAASLRGAFKRHIVHFPADAPFARWLTTELLTFPNAIGQGVDDGVDALGLMGRRMAAIAPASPPSASVRKPPPDPRGTFYTATLDELWMHHHAAMDNRGFRQRI